MIPEPKDNLDAATLVVVSRPEDAPLTGQVEASVRRLHQRIFTGIGGGGPRKGPPAVAGWRDRSLELGRDCRPLAAGGCQPCHADGRGDRRGHVGEGGRCRLRPDDDQQLAAVAEIGVYRVAEGLLRRLPSDSQGAAASGQLKTRDLARPWRPGRPEGAERERRAREPVLLDDRHDRRWPAGPVCGVKRILPVALAVVVIR